MRHKFFLGVAAGTAIAVFAVPASASAPTLTITSPADGSTLEFTSFDPAPLVPVTGTVAREHTEGGAGNHNVAKDDVDSYRAQVESFLVENGALD